MLIGFYAGQIRDIAPLYARQLIAVGHAEDPNAPLPEVHVELPTPEIPETKAKKRGR